MNSSRLAYLFEQHQQRVLTQPEKEELFILLGDVTNRKEAETLMGEHWNRFSEADNAIFSSNELDGMLEKIGQQQKPARIYVALRWTAAAAVLLALGIGYIVQKERKEVKTETIAKVEDVKPGTNKAILTLPNGEKVIMDSAGVLDYTSGAPNHLQKKEGNTTTAYNELHTPRGGQYRLVLADGTKVWLNAASSIKYPSAFNERERRVDVTGEVYFEVEKDQRKPFKVYSNGQEIQVLGTSFNINTYDDEPVKKTTLLSGSIKIKDNQHALVLKPGEQLRIDEEQWSTATVQGEEVIAWKDGLFNFQNASFAEVMRQLSRWYNINVRYEGDIPKIDFEGKLGRDVNLSKMLIFFRESGIQCRMEQNNTLIISNK